MTYQGPTYKDGNPLEQSTVFTIARINSQIATCDNLLARLSALEERKAELAQGERRLSDRSREIDVQHSRQLEEASDAVLTMKETLSAVETETKDLKLLLEQKQQRLEGLESGRLSSEDIDLVTVAVEEKTKPIKETIVDLDSRISEAWEKIKDIAVAIQFQKAELSNLQDDLETFNNGNIPESFLAPIEEVRKKASEGQEREIEAASDRLTDLTAKLSRADSKIEVLNKKIAELKENNLELEKVSEQKFLKRLSSSAWVGSFFTNYEKEIEEKTREKNNLIRQRSSCRATLASTQENHDSIILNRSQVIEEAVQAERAIQLGLCQDMVETIPLAIRNKNKELASTRSDLQSLECRLVGAREELKQLTEQAAETARQELIEMVKVSLDESRDASVSTEKKVSLTKERFFEATERLERLRAKLSDEKSGQLQKMVQALDELRRELSLDEIKLLEDAKGHGVEGTIANIREAIIARRSGLVYERQQKQGGGALREENVDDDTLNDEFNATGSSAESESSTEEKQPVITGTIYLDFEKNEDDNQDDRGKTYSGLRTQLEGLRRKHGNIFFQDMPAGADLLATFIETFFPEGISQSYFICNLSLRADQPYLQIRPQMIGPRLERHLPRGMSLAVAGKLWDKQRDQDNPVFLVQKIIDLSHSAKLPFEQSFSGFVFTLSHNVYPSFKRQENALSNDFVAQLPLISIETKRRLKDWRDYLGWRERLVQSRLVGLRYDDVEVLDDGRVRFLTVCESKEKFDQVRRTLRSDELYAYGLNYSQDPWEFEYNERHRGRGAELGDFAGQEEVVGTGDLDIDGMPWDKPYFTYIYFRLPEESQNEFDSIIDSGGTTKEAAQRYLSQTDTSGFLALSVVGDMALIKRQRSELQQLQEQSGYAPFLSSYLFDIKAASEPSELVAIDDARWLQSDLNDDQKLAVRKMISTPDLAMVQGPPGTGKTTMIAEATWQLVHDGKKVLLVSQASLAVNNALERLAQIPAIRAIRLSRRERRNEREHPYSQSNAIETYYRSVANTCRSRTLDVWSDADEKLAAVTNWLKSVDLVSADVDSLRSKTNALAQQSSDLKTELKRLKESDECAREIMRQQREAAAFRAFISGEGSFSGAVPEPVLRTLYERIIVPLNRLPEVGIRVNTLWAQYDYGSLSERTRFAVETLLAWRKVAEFKSQIHGDRERIRASEGDSVLSPESAIRLAELQRQFKVLTEVLADDGSKLDEWQSLQKEIRKIKREGSGLDRETYARLLNVPENKFLAILTDAGSSKTQVVETLDAVDVHLSEIDAQVKDGAKEVCAELDRYVESLSTIEVDKDEIHSLEGELRHLGERQKEMSSGLSSKEKRLREILADRSGDSLGRKPEIGDLHSLRSSAEQERDTLTECLEQSKSFRDSWGDVLQRWANDLTDPETIKSDQENFLQTYVKACNVVGVTCTERRHTLEESGHMWFDTVIVDEVSKATPTEIIMPLMMGRTAILVGDHRQLPPLFKEQEGSWEEVMADQEELNDEDQNSDSELTAENFDRFKKMVTSSLFKEHFENAPENLKSFLFTQYRMHPQIMRVVNQFYENKLKCGLDDPDGIKTDSDPRGHRLHGLTLNGEKGLQYVVPDRHVAWLDSTLDPYRRPHHERRDLGTSKVNELECILIAKSLFDIELSCRELGFGSKGTPRKQVGIVTFYGRQVRAIREAIRRMQNMRSLQFKAIEFDINTVDRYQGQERPIIIVSMVRNPQFKLSQRANTAQFERINVAFSRAQELLIVAGAKDVFCTYPVMLPYLDKPGKRKVEVYRYILDEIQRSGGLWSSDQIVSPSDYDRLLPSGFVPGRSNRRSSRYNNGRQGRVSK